MRFFSQSVLVLALAAGLQACASGNLDRRLDERVAQEKDVNSRKDLDAKTASMVKDAPGLSEVQRAKMDALRSQVQAKMKSLNAESMKLRELLVQDVLSREDKSAEIKDLKNRLRANSKARVETIFSAVDQANDNLGRTRLIQQAMDLQMMEDGADF